MTTFSKNPAAGGENDFKGKTSLPNIGKPDEFLNWKPVPDLKS
jgi:hypothetical protein